jgi:hypothetical protein
LEPYLWSFAPRPPLLWMTPPSASFSSGYLMSAIYVSMRQLLPLSLGIGHTTPNMSDSYSDQYETPQEYFFLSDELRKRVFKAKRATQALASDPQAQRESPDLCWMCEQLCDLLVAGIEPYGDDEWRGSFSPDLYQRIQAFLGTGRPQPEARIKPAKEGIATLVALNDAYIRSRDSGVATTLLTQGSSQPASANPSQRSTYKSWKKQISTFLSGIVSL